MLKEIGSEFWELGIENNTVNSIEHDHLYLLSGRTALDYIIKDIKHSRKLDSVLLPSYCCFSMIQPFVNNNVKIEFYEVEYNNGRYDQHFDLETNCDAVLLMQYFGFQDDSVHQAITSFKNSGKIVIEDATHSWFSHNAFSKYSDYVFASFRKWTGIPGGAIAIKNVGQFSIDKPKQTNQEYIQLREEAAKEKKLFITKNTGNKDVFLNKFMQAETILDNDYANYNIPTRIEKKLKQLDSNTLKKQRITNAKFLIEQIKTIDGIQTVHYSPGNVPLFVPIIVENNKRDILRKFLTDNFIYCPIHWPLSDYHKVNNKFLFENTLSIPCDQRYAIPGMERIIETIRQFFSKRILN